MLKISVVGLFLLEMIHVPEMISENFISSVAQCFNFFVSFLLYLVAQYHLAK